MSAGLGDAGQARERAVSHCVNLQAAVTCEASVGTLPPEVGFLRKFSRSSCHGTYGTWGLLLHSMGLRTHPAKLRKFSLERPSMQLCWPIGLGGVPEAKPHRKGLVLGRARPRVSGPADGDSVFGFFGGLGRVLGGSMLTDCRSLRGCMTEYGRVLQ